MPLSRDTIKRYRTLGHDLKPIVTVADNGLTENVINEVNRALEDHELVKVKIAVNDRDARKEITASIAKQCKAETVQEIGKVGLFFRTSTKKNIKTSNVR